MMELKPTEKTMSKGRVMERKCEDCTIGIYYCMLSGTSQLISESDGERYKNYENFSKFKYCPDCGRKIK